MNAITWHLKNRSHGTYLHFKLNIEALLNAWTIQFPSWGPKQCFLLNVAQLVYREVRVSGNWLFPRLQVRQEHLTIFLRCSQVSHTSIAHISCLVCVCQSLPRTLPPQSTHESKPATRDRNAALSQCIEWMSSGWKELIINWTELRNMKVWGSGIDICGKKGRK